MASLPEKYRILEYIVDPGYFDNLSEDEISSAIRKIERSFKGVVEPTYIEHIVNLGLQKYNRDTIYVSNRQAGSYSSRVYAPQREDAIRVDCYFKRLLFVLKGDTHRLEELDDDAKVIFHNAPNAPGVPCTYFISKIPPNIYRGMGYQRVLSVGLDIPTEYTNTGNIYNAQIFECEQTPIYYLMVNFIRSEIKGNPMIYFETNDRILVVLDRQREYPLFNFSG